MSKFYPKINRKEMLFQQYNVLNKRLKPQNFYEKSVSEIVLCTNFNLRFFSKYSNF